MKKCIFATAVAAVLLTACDGSEATHDSVNGNVKKDVTFVIDGDFGNATFRKAKKNVTAVDGSDMQDVYVVDHVDGSFVQLVHQTKDDADFGRPSVPMTYGTHTLYFIASRGTGSEIDTDSHTVTWDGVKDTYYKAVTVDVSASSAAVRNITLDRVVTKIKINIKDEVPEGIASINLTPGLMYKGFDYVADEPVDEVYESEYAIDVPESYVGTKNLLSVSIFSLSGSDEWTTDLKVLAKDTDGKSIGGVSIESVPLLRNRATEYTGKLFITDGTASMTLNDEWLPSYSDTW